MNLQTQIPLSPKEPQINYQSKVVLMGSCFTENIGGKLDYFQFQNIQNPFGVIFNPVSIEKLIFRALHDDFYTENDVFQHKGLWHCYEVHSSLSMVDKSEFLNSINLQLSHFKTYLLEASHIIFTLGSAWVYLHNNTSEIVANCQKVPQKEFSKEILSMEMISKSLQNCISEINEVNPKVTFIFTVSPVRHIKDGFAENTLSKSHLLSAVHPSISTIENAHYFPSYELMMDELRDYRFYKEDMLHPNDTAIQYIWEKFNRVWISAETTHLQNEIAAIHKGLQHKPFNPDSEEHSVFQKNLQKSIEKLQKELPWIQF
ncbi:GSCFA domain-containing protein [Aureisphaera sp. CAU 1614]|uniref:GSCFA domain-containing protein n=1 Tax=Halomarinibacterium sedimenti TaxID=2857106 RepID=A0A9X1FN70_9FLAO|nr:GSCFA domain-containing protein [Halomarinibacterium sedimenti]MBW2936747.1 GSCFA domain-containing protein [Halomarinibacterium sedimenti]